MRDVEIEQDIPRRLPEQFGIAENRRALAPHGVDLPGMGQIAPLGPLRAYGRDRADRRSGNIAQPRRDGDQFVSERLQMRGRKQIRLGITHASDPGPALFGAENYVATRSKPSLATRIWLYGQIRRVFFFLRKSPELVAQLLKPQMLDRGIQMRRADRKAERIERGELVFKGRNDGGKAGSFRRRRGGVVQSEIPKLAARSC